MSRCRVVDQCAICIKLIPDSVDRLPAFPGDAVAAEIIPLAVEHLPAFPDSAVAAEIIPLAVEHLPASPDDAVTAEIILLAVDGLPARHHHAFEVGFVLGVTLIHKVVTLAFDGLEAGRPLGHHVVFTAVGRDKAFARAVAFAVKPIDAAFGFCKGIVGKDPVRSQHIFVILLHPLAGEHGSLCIQLAVVILFGIQNTADTVYFTRLIKCDRDILRLICLLVDDPLVHLFDISAGLYPDISSLADVSDRSVVAGTHDVCRLLHSVHAAADIVSGILGRCGQIIGKIGKRRSDRVYKHLVIRSVIAVMAEFVDVRLQRCAGFHQFLFQFFLGIPGRQKLGPASREHDHRRLIVEIMYIALISLLLGQSIDTEHFSFHRPYLDRLPLFQIDDFGAVLFGGGQDPRGIPALVSVVVAVLLIYITG